MPTSTASIPRDELLVMHMKFNSIAKFTDCSGWRQAVGRAVRALQGRAAGRHQPGRGRQPGGAPEASLVHVEALSGLLFRARLLHCLLMRQLCKSFEMIAMRNACRLPGHASV